MKIIMLKELRQTRQEGLLNTSAHKTGEFCCAPGSKGDFRPRRDEMSVVQ